MELEFGDKRSVERVTADQACTRNVEGERLAAQKCDKDEGLFHRTSTEAVLDIVDDGELKPSDETGVVSLTSNPSSFVGGATRFRFNPSRLAGQTRAMCYVPSNTRASEKLKELRSEANRNTDKGDKYDPFNLGTFSANRFRAENGISTNVYERECEYMSDKPVDLDKAEEVEYFIKGGGGIVNADNDAVAPLKQTYGGIEPLREEIQKAKKAADRVGADFSVNSCFSVLKVEDGSFMGNYEYAKLDKENLERLENGEELKTFERSEPIRFDSDIVAPKFC